MPDPATVAQQTKQQSSATPSLSFRKINLAMLKKISVDHARAGMYVHELCGSWFDNPFWNPTFPLRNSTDVNKLQASGVRELWIDTSKGCDVESPDQDQDEANAAAPVQDPVPAPPAFAFVPQAAASMQDEVARATKILKKTRDAVGVMFEDARMGRMASAQAAMPLVEEIASSVMRNSGALVSLVRLKQADDYTYMHSVAVCAMMIALARQLELSDEEVRDYGLAGLLHDIGKMAIPGAILNKPGRLTDEEFLTVKGHPSAGYDMLKTVEGMPEIVLDVCLHHHERMDGMGYPDQLAMQTLSQAARVGAICDVYDAITSNRPYKQGWSPTESLRKMATWAKEGHFDEKLFAAFVKCIGIYPVGTLVRLKSNRLGVVIDNSKSLLKPTVRVFFSITSMAYQAPTTIDLSRPGTMEAIAASEEAHTWKIRNLDSYWTAE